MEQIINQHKFYWSQKNFLISALVGLVFLGLSVIINYYANLFAIEEAGNPVTDLLLNVLPLVDTNILFVEGSFLSGKGLNLSNSSMTNIYFVFLLF